MREVRVASLSVNASGGISERLEQIGPVIEQAGTYQPDFIILPEYSISLPKTPDTVPGQIVDTMANYARQFQSHMIVPLVHQTDEGTIYNSAFWLDREGEVRGVYRKMFATDYEMQGGITPGDATPVFESDVGKFGISICFDLNFYEVAQGLAAGGAEMVFFVSAYEGGRQLARWALDWGFYVVSAHRGGHGHIIDKTGRPVQSSTPVYPIMVRTINLDREVFHLDYNRKQLKEIVKRYGDGVELDICTPEAFFALESRMHDTTVADIKKEYQLETYQEYINRSRQARLDCLAGKPIKTGLGEP